MADKETDKMSEENESTMVAREWLYAEGLKDIEVAYRYRSIILRAWFQRCKDALDHEHNIFYITLNSHFLYNVMLTPLPKFFVQPNCVRH